MSPPLRERAVWLLHQGKWRIIWALGVLLPAGWALRLLLGSPPVVTPSTETTFLTGHNLPDGSLDFSAALWHHCNTPIEDSDNAAILLRELAEPQQLTSFLNRYAMEQADNSEHAWEIFAALSQEQGLSLAEHGHLKTVWTVGRRVYGFRLVGEWAQAVHAPWTGEQFPAITKLLEDDAEYLDQWKAAIRRPAISKPLGTTIDEVRAAIYKGANRCLVQGMMYAGEEDWNSAIENFDLIDRAANHLCQLQCGWLFQQGMMLRTEMTVALTGLIRNSDSIDLQFGEYIRHRCNWPVMETLANTIDGAIRIRAQTNVRDIRDPESRKLESWLGRGLTTVDAARAVQITQLRNSIGWETVARIQNEAIDEYLRAVEQNGLGHLRSRLSTIWSAQAGLQHDEHLIDTISHMTGEDITVPAGWSLALGFVPRRVMNAANQAVHVARVDRKAVFAIAIAEFREQQERWPSTIDELSNPLDTIDPVTDQPFPYHPPE